MQYFSSAKSALSVGEFCQLCSTGRTSFYGAVRSGQIKVVKFGTRTLVPADQIGAFLERLAEAG